MQTVKMKLSDLHKTDKNIRRHSEKQISEYIRSLEMFGQMRPFVVTEDGEILIGNGMYDAMTQMGWEEGDAYVVSGLSKTQKRKLMMADNKVYELGFTDVGVLESLLIDLDGDFDIPGYDASLLDAISGTTADTTREILDYGNMEIEEREPVDPEFGYAGEQPHSVYAPPVKDADGGFVAPTQPTADASERPYIICPKCGEKIWL